MLLTSGVSARIDSAKVFVDAASSPDDAGDSTTDSVPFAAAESPTPEIAGAEDSAAGAAEGTGLVEISLIIFATITD